MGDKAVRAYHSITTDRGVTTVPSALRVRGAIRPKSELTWVAIEPDLWLVGPKSRHPEEVAQRVAAALAEDSPFQKLLGRVMSGETPSGPASGLRRRYNPIEAPELTEEQMVALGAPATSRRVRRTECRS